MAHAAIAAEQGESSRVMHPRAQPVERALDLPDERYHAVESILRSVAPGGRLESVRGASINGKELCRPVHRRPLAMSRLRCCHGCRQTGGRCGAADDS